MKFLISEKGIDDALQRYDRLGPTARLCLAMDADQVEAYVGARDASIAKTSPDIFEKFFSSFHQKIPHDDDLSHRICLIRRRRGSPLGHAANTTQLISAAVKQQVVKRLEDFSIDQLLGMWKNFSRFGDARGMAGTIFEAFVHREFSTGIELTAIPMVLSKSQTSRWHALSSTRRPKTATIHGTEQKNFRLQVKVDRTFVYAVNTATTLNVEPDVYYILRSGQQVAFNSFIFSGGYLNLFQCTAGENHTIKDGLTEFLASCSGLPADTHRHFIFVLPNNFDSFSCAASDNSAVKEVGLYTACISVSR
ncbi:hypothetical protein BGW80DRAFT_1287530 [Lactifluus volemus]|nr:hypothetical protein BGW80DRAFT_1287530 [Lactifluus volemus]